MELPDMVEIKLREPRSYRVAKNRSGKRRPNDDPLSLRRQGNLARRVFPYTPEAYPIGFIQWPTASARAAEAAKSKKS